MANIPRKQQRTSSRSLIAFPLEQYQQNALDEYRTLTSDGSRDVLQILHDSGWNVQVSVLKLSGAGLVVFIDDLRER